MITSNLDRKNHPSRIYVDIETDIGKKTGLLTNSVIMTDNIVTIKFKEIYKRIGVFNKMAQLKKRLSYTFRI